MLRAVVHASEVTDLGNTEAKLRAQCESAGLAGDTTELVVRDVMTVLAELVERGKQLAAIGSQMQVSRTISGADYHVQLIFGAGEREPWWRKFAKIFAWG